MTQNMTKWIQWALPFLLGTVVSSGAWVLRQDKAAAVNFQDLQNQIELMKATTVANSVRIDKLEDSYTELLKLTAAIDAKVDILLSRDPDD